MIPSADVTGVDRLTAAELRDSRAAWWSEQFTATIRRLLGEIDGGRVLDIGCGTGILREKLQSTSHGPSRVIGIDIDLGRLIRAPETANAKGQSLPFSRATFDAAATILTLQHVPDPLAVLVEMSRVTRAGGIVLAVEADNCDQRLYLSTAAPALEEKYSAFWQAVAVANPDTHFQLGPRLLGLFSQAGFRESQLEGFLVTQAKTIDLPLFLSSLHQRIQALADRHGVAATEQSSALLAAIEHAQENSSPSARSSFISTTPLFLVTGRVQPAA